MNIKHYYYYYYYYHLISVNYFLNNQRARWAFDPARQGIIMT